MKNSNNEGSVRRRADGRWEGRYTDGRTPDGKQIQRSVYGKTKKEVKDKLTEVQYHKNQGIYIQPNKMLLSDWLCQWLANYAAIKVRPSTYISYEGYVYNHVIPFLGSIPIQKITPAVMQNFYNQKFQSGRIDGRGGLSAKTLKNMHNMLHLSFEQAKMNGIIFNNPTDGTVLPTKEKEELRILSVQEQSALINAAPMHRLGFAIMFDLATGLRIGELCGLKWSDINIVGRSVKISRTLQRIKKSKQERKENLLQC